MPMCRAFRCVVGCAVSRAVGRAVGRAVARSAGLVRRVWRAGTAGLAGVYGGVGRAVGGAGTAGRFGRVRRRWPQAEGWGRRCWGRLGVRAWGTLSAQAAGGRLSGFRAGRCAPSRLVPSVLFGRVPSGRARVVRRLASPFAYAPPFGVGRGQPPPAAVLGLAVPSLSVPPPPAARCSRQALKTLQALPQPPAPTMCPQP